MPIVQMTGITKRFGAVLANDHVDLALEAGEIHALLGENGAGKTTLMNILSGLYTPDEGEISIRGQACHIDSPRKALSLGIGMVHQHFMLAAPLTVGENIVLGMKTSRSPLLGLADAEKRILELSDRYHLCVDPKAYVWQLSAGERQRVEILKLLYRKADILILDEPTAVLTPNEAGQMYGVVSEMAKQGHTVVLISHKLEEVTAWANRITVLRDGRVVNTVAANVSRPELARMMVGREVLFQYDRVAQAPGDVVLSMEHITARGAKGTAVLKDVSLQVRCGEIVGIAGVAGNGQSELADAIAGLVHVETGKITLAGHDITNRPPAEVTAQGLGYVPEDRQEAGLLLEMNIAENLILKQHNQAPFVRRASLDGQAIRKNAEELVARYNIRVPGITAPVVYLSGGNQQKVVLAREFGLAPKVMVAAQPTRGLDVGATESVRKLLLKARQEGMGILLISTELEEILSLSDRILVIFQGKIGLESDASRINQETLGLAMAGEEVTC
jgi:general nucleoside transport system ATP-binding protein